MENSDHGTTYIRVGRDDGELRPWHYMYIHSIESRLKGGGVPEGPRRKGRELQRACPAARASPPASPAFGFRVCNRAQGCRLYQTLLQVDSKPDIVVQIYKSHIQNSSKRTRASAILPCLQSVTPSESCFRGSGFGVWISEFGVRVSGFGFRVSGFEVRASGVGFRDSGSGFGVRISGFGLSGFRFRV